MSTLKRVLNVIQDASVYPCFRCTHEEPRFCIYRGHKCANSRVRFRGVYSTYDAVVAALPLARPRGFDNEKVVKFFREKLSSLDQGDYPILLRLSQILRPGGKLFDLGGGYGQCYYAYRNHIELPEDISWVVCDVPSFTRIGEEIAHERNAGALSFTDDRQNANASLVFLANGTLQYLETGLAEILNQLDSKPLHVLINRTPMHSRDTFYTMQYGAFSYSPYKVTSEGEFVRSMELLGYKKIDQWALPRSLRIPFHPDYTVPAYQGFYFKLMAS